MFMRISSQKYDSTQKGVHTLQIETLVNLAFDTPNPEKANSF